MIIYSPSELSTIEIVTALQNLTSNGQDLSLPQTYAIQEITELLNPNKNSEMPMPITNQLELTDLMEGVDRAIQISKRLPITAKTPIVPKIGLYHSKVGP